jgi:hypothetical protein
MAYDESLWRYEYEYSYSYNWQNRDVSPFSTSPSSLKVWPASLAYAVCVPTKIPAGISAKALMMSPTTDRELFFDGI